MSGIKFRDFRRVSNGDSVCLLQCACPPGRPMQLWFCDGLLPTVQEETDNDALSAMWALLHFLDSKGRKG
jgi:hypothetical protein